MKKHKAKRSKKTSKKRSAKKGSGSISKTVNSLKTKIHSLEKRTGHLEHFLASGG